MITSKYPLTIRRGTVLDIAITWRDPDGNPVDLTGYKASLQIRRSPEDAAILEDWTDGPGGEISLGGKSGTIQLRIPANITKAMGWQEGIYDLVLGTEYESEEPIRLLEGTAKVTT